MATVKYPIWLSLFYSMGPILLPTYRVWRRMAGSTTDQGFRVLLFHDIPEDRMEGFARLVQYLASHHALMTPKQAEDVLEGQSLLFKEGQTPYLLTFDDGFESQARAAREVLEPLDVKAVFFVCPRLMDASGQEQRHQIAKQMFDGLILPDDLPKELSLMSWDSLNRLVTAGHTIGSHTGSHRRLSALGTESRVQEIVDSADLLESRINQAVRWFAFPFGDVGSIDASALEIIGRRYAYCCSGVAGPNNALTDPLGISRANIDLDLAFSYQLFVLEGGMDFRYRRRAMQYRSMLSTTSQTEATL